MTDAIIWLVAIGLVVLMFWSLLYEQRKRAKMTDEEYQQRAKEEPGLISSGMMAFDQIVFRPQAKAAIEYQKDKMSGQTDDQQTAGEKLKDNADEPPPHTD
jgi:cbb3-type cytochrome oxidase subunit 3